jgi:hypothetical protein
MQVVCCMLSQKASGICGPITFLSLFLVLYNETKRGNGRVCFFTGRYFLRWPGRRREWPLIPDYLGR